MYMHNGHTQICDEKCFNCSLSYKCENYDDTLTANNCCNPDVEVKESKLEQLRIDDFLCPLSFEEFILDRVNDAINSYYKLGYEDRRVAKYLYLSNKEGRGFGHSKDLFIISGSRYPKNLKKYISELSDKKSTRIKSVIEKIYYWQLKHFVGFDDRSPESGALFDTDVISKISRNVFKDEDTKTFYTDKRYLNMEYYKTNSSIIDAYKRYYKTYTSIKTDNYVEI